MTKNQTPQDPHLHKFLVYCFYNKQLTVISREIYLDLISQFSLKKSLPFHYM